MKILSSLVSLLPTQTVSAHCDVPCGIYDPYTAQIAAYTVIRMTQLIQAAHKETEDANGEKVLMHNIARYTAVKEEHAERVKHEIRVIWGDYFKAEQLQEYPQLNELVFQIMKLASKARQAVDMEASQKLLTAVQEFSEIFWKSKGRETTRIKSPFPVEGELVLPK